MKDRYLKIAGIEIDLIDELDVNLEVLTNGMLIKQDFKYLMDKAINESSFTKSIFDFLNVFLIKVSLFPRYVIYQTKYNERARTRDKARNILREHYQKPETIILRSRLQCQLNIESYTDEINEVKKEKSRLELDLQLAQDDEHLVQEINLLLKGYNSNLNQKENKLNFYQNAIEKITKLENKMMLIKNIEASKQKFTELEQKPFNDDLEDTIKKDVLLYEEYGNLLTEISKNINRISNDKEEQIEEIELKSIVENIKI